MGFPELNCFAFPRALSQAQPMTKPLALVLYEKLLPGSQVVNRLQDLGYRVQSLTEPGRLVAGAEETKPMLVVLDWDCTRVDVRAEVTRLKQNTATAHLPVIAFGREVSAKVQQTAAAAGVTLFVSEAAIVNHLPQLLDQALQVE